MNRLNTRIPTTDYMGRELKLGDKAIIFTRFGIHWEGTITKVDGRVWFEVDKTLRLGGIGNCHILKEVKR